MKAGDKIYRVVKLHDNKWYFCVYECIRIVKCCINGIDTQQGWVEAAPILTFYNASYKSHSTFQFKHSNPDILLDEWVRGWDYISDDEQLALAVYKEKTKDENQRNNKNASTSKDRD